MYKNQGILCSENGPENDPEMWFWTKNVFSSKILFYNEFQ